MKFQNKMVITKNDKKTKNCRLLVFLHKYSFDLYLKSAIRTATPWLRRLKIEQFDIKNEGWLWWDETGKTTVTVGIVWWTRQFCSFASGHLSHTFIPTLSFMLLFIDGDQRMFSVYRKRFGEKKFLRIQFWKV